MNQSNLKMLMDIMQNQAIDPTKLDKRFKRNTSQSTISDVMNGLYSKLPRFKSVPFTFQSDYDPGIPDNICTVEVVNQHVLEAVEPYCDHGVNYANNNDNNPIILNSVGNEFSGINNIESCDNIRDDMIVMRTSYYTSFDNETNFPLKIGECVYSKLITAIKAKNLVHIPINQTFRFSMVTITPIVTQNLLSNNRMKSDDFINTCTNIESVFQVAISRHHSVLVLPPFGHVDDNNPIDDIIKIYNYCIFKYGHYFKKIIIAVPQYYPDTVYKAYISGIVNPSEIVSVVDKKFEQDQMKEELLKKSNSNNKSIPVVNETPDINYILNNLSPDQLKSVMSMIKQ